MSHSFCSVIECSEDTLEVLSVSDSPPFHKSSVGFCCCKGEAAVAVWALQGELDTGTVTIPSQGSNSAQQLWGGGARGHSQPLSPLPGPPGPVHSEEGRVPDWASICAPITTFHQTAVLKKPFLDSTTYSCPPRSSARTTQSPAPQ